MTISGRTRLLAAAGAALALTLTGPAYAGTGPGSKTATKPLVGDCHKLSVDEANAKTQTTPAIDCSLAHNTRVIAVRNLPGGATYDNVTRAQLGKAVEKICYPAMRKAVSTNNLVFDRTSYSFVWFEPTKAQKADGARWVRCDLTLVHGSTYGDLPTDRVPAVKGTRVTASAKRCLTGTNHFTTTCTARHNYRATGAFAVASKTFPGRRQMIKIGDKRCPALVSTRSFFFSWKTKHTYNVLHDHTIVCFSKTTS